MRRRALELSKSDSSEMALSKRERLFSTYQELRQMAEENGSQRWQDIGLSFCGGLVVFFFSALVVRKIRNSHFRSGTYRLLSRSEADQLI
jgi:hypothetical protein